jgi:hypothetical protein
MCLDGVIFYLMFQSCSIYFWILFYISWTFKSGVILDLYRSQICFWHRRQSNVRWQYVMFESDGNLSYSSHILSTVWVMFYLFLSHVLSIVVIMFKLLLVILLFSILLLFESGSIFYLLLESCSILHDGTILNEFWPYIFGYV